MKNAGSYKRKNIPFVIKYVFLNVSRLVEIFLKTRQLVYYYGEEKLNELVIVNDYSI